MTRQTQESMPPGSLSELKALLAEITGGRSELRLGGRALRTLAAMVADPHHTAVLSIGKLAESHGVNASTLTRMSQRLGYDRFTALQQIFRRHVSERGGFYSQRADRLTESSRQDPAMELINRIAKEELGNISAMTEDLETSAVEAAAGVIADVPRVSIYGARQSASVAGFMAYALGMLRNNTALLDGQQQGVAHGLAQLEEGDALVLIGSSPYTRATVAASRVAADRGIQVIALTDSLASPLAATATHVFVTPTAGSFFSNCMASSAVLVEILLSAVAKRLEQRAVAALNRHEALIEALDIQI
ncbi:MAG: MurR/RpiR family transcriptional regulator [Gammaproteobacteria bacterium]|nr:MurR/RpiR family transcriptional regulator [Gammaproteobacteria bacterium]